MKNNNNYRKTFFPGHLIFGTTTTLNFPVESKKIEKDTNFRIKNNINYLSLPSIYFASLKRYLFLFSCVSVVFTRFYSIFPFPWHYPPYLLWLIFFYTLLSLSCPILLHPYSSIYTYPPIILKPYPFLYVNSYPTESIPFFNILIHFYLQYTAKLSIHFNLYLHFIFLSIFIHLNSSSTLIF